jgi:hypothetical protein
LLPNRKAKEHCYPALPGDGGPSHRLFGINPADVKNTNLGLCARKCARVVEQQVNNSSTTRVRKIKIRTKQTPTQSGRRVFVLVDTGQAIQPQKVPQIVSYSILQLLRLVRTPASLSNKDRDAHTKQSVLKLKA